MSRTKKYFIWTTLGLLLGLFGSGVIYGLDLLDGEKNNAVIYSLPWMSALFAALLLLIKEKRDDKINKILDHQFERDQSNH